MYHTDHTTVYLNGEWLHVSKAHTDLYNQTMHYGLGVFEGMKSYPTPLGTQVFKAHKHYERLLNSCKKMNINLNYTVDELVAITYQLLDKNNLKDAYIRPLVFVGADMSLKLSQEINIFICAWEWDPYLGNKLLRVVSSTIERPNPKSCHIDAKVTGHYVTSILAVKEARDKGYHEALLNDMNGYVAEGPGSNFFYEQDCIIYTAPKGHILPGITRSTVMDLALELGITVKEKLFTVKDVEGADSAFFTGTAAEVVGLQSLNDVKFKKKWEDTLGYQLHKAYQGLVLSAEVHVVGVV